LGFPTYVNRMKSQEQEKIRVKFLREKSVQ